MLVGQIAAAVVATADPAILQPCQPGRVMSGALAGPAPAAQHGILDEGQRDQSNSQRCQSLHLGRIEDHVADDGPQEQPAAQHDLLVDPGHSPRGHGAGCQTVAEFLGRARALDMNRLARDKDHEFFACQRGTRRLTIPSSGRIES